ncbi:ZIP family metal transporter [Patescibacteria group bacterium]|nr:ZIP family metal transporter [Patescibacteria group bacterium]MCG2701863.1 ZIP family metal transporter [Candidatus Parcubacteria bacterium]MBU4210115.1 ZIP family metal transporter [Patescibacteria group bacterium]MBU4265416.1 ZIP family metal transporter [Patescibacteria group bacterium]MBU4390368.1 ZIP family metal transporter [Patescibacteria group bacterium]
MRLMWIVGATLLISLVSLIGLVGIILSKKTLKNVLVFLVSLSAGTLMGGVFLHLLPEAMEELETKMVLNTTLLSFLLFFVLEKVLGWRHCHESECEIHSFGYMNLFGDAIHNFVDGLVIAGAFVNSIPLGMSTSLAILVHEIPQEIGDFGVLVHAGFKKRQALLMNFLSGLAAVFGALLGYFISESGVAMEKFLLPLAAGGFLYIGASDLLPEIRKEKSLKKSILSFVIFLVGIGMMWLLVD